MGNQQQRMQGSDPSGSGSGGGKMGTGASTNPAAATNLPVASNERYIVSRVTNWTFTAIIAANGVPQSMPGMIVPSGCGVRVRGYNGTTAGNSSSVFVANYRAALLNGGGTPLAPLDDVSFPANNTAEIWMRGTAGDGVVVSVTTS